MPVHIDHPAPGMAFDPRQFAVRGWVWLEHRHGDVVSVEACSGEISLGHTAEFYVRSDVSEKYRLPAGTATAFDFQAAHPTAAQDEQFTLELRARLRDGTRTPPIFSSLVGPLPLERDPHAMLQAQLDNGALGLEIGAHTKPTRGLTPFFTDSVADFAGTAGRVDFLSDARTLPLPDATLDYVCSSHVLEHLPDPIAALHEWHRVLRPGGLLYLVVPDKRFTFDEPRTVTSCSHLLRDFLEATTAEASIEHVDEFIYHTHWSHLRPQSSREHTVAEQAAARAEYLDCIARHQPIDIHFHTFTPDSLDALLHATGFTGGDAARFAVVAQAERYPPERTDGIARLMRKRGSPEPRAAAETFALSLAAGDPRALPLVCPVTLQPLRSDTEADGTRRLVARDGTQRYDFAGERPILLPSAAARSVRPWSRRSWRMIQQVKAQVRLAFSAGSR